VVDARKRGPHQELRHARYTARVPVIRRFFRAKIKFSPQVTFFVFFDSSCINGLGVNFRFIAGADDMIWTRLRFENA
jgi:hypothetical protein